MATPTPAAKPGAKTGRPEARAVETAKPAVRSETTRATVAAVATSLQDVEGMPPMAPPAARGDTKFTVQVGAFKARGPAEALRARLAERGQEASVTEVETAGVMQYRVRVGSFATREAAQEAASRLATERRLSTYVTTR
jgi:DedD protein